MRFAAERTCAPDEAVVIVCRSSRFRQVRLLDGGMRRWKEPRQPVER